MALSYILLKAVLSLSSPTATVSMLSLITSHLKTIPDQQIDYLQWDHGFGITLELRADSRQHRVYARVTKNTSESGKINVYIKCPRVVAVLSIFRWAL